MSVGRMHGRHVLVCGGTSGIGKAAALHCAAEGAKVAVIGTRPAAVAEMAEAVGGFGVAADMTDEAQAARAVEELATRLGALDGLVNCIGRPAYGALAEIDLAEFNAVLSVNLTTCYLASRAALPHLQRQPHAAIVNISALAGVLPGVTSAPYAAAKAAVIQFTRTLAAQLAPAVRANSVCPGAVRTPAMAEFLAGKTEAQVQAFLDRYAVRRLAEPEEIASLIVFLLSAEASYLTGCNYVADGGRAFR